MTRGIVGSDLARFCFTTLVLSFTVASSGQTRKALCNPELPISAQAAMNMFDEQQERWLGEIAWDTNGLDSRLILEPRKIPELNRTLDRLAAALPTRSVQFRAQMFSSSELDAFGLPDGRIYLSNGLFRLTHNGDEVAFILAHELGHVLAHHFAISTTRQLREMLRVRAVGDKEDIRKKYRELARISGADSADQDSPRDEDEADQIALVLMSKAGYRAEASLDLWKSVMSSGQWDVNSLQSSVADRRRSQHLRNEVNALNKVCGQEQHDWTSWKGVVVDALQRSLLADAQ